MAPKRRASAGESVNYSSSLATSAPIPINREVRLGLFFLGGLCYFVMSVSYSRKAVAWLGVIWCMFWLMCPLACLFACLPGLVVVVLLLLPFLFVSDFLSPLRPPESSSDHRHHESPPKLCELSC